MAAIIKVTGDFKKTKTFLGNLAARTYLNKLRNLAERGAAALSAATPIDTGETAASWSYDIIEESGHVKIVWTNDNLADTRTPIAVLIQTGHATRNGGYVVGRDYINPAIRPIFDQIANEAWLEVKNS